MNIEPVLHAPLAIKDSCGGSYAGFDHWDLAGFLFDQGRAIAPRLRVCLSGIDDDCRYVGIFIRSVGRGNLTPIHLFIPLTFFGVFAALWHARHGHIERHRRAMLGLYFGGLLLAGTLAFLPGRIMYRVLFG